MAVKNKEGFVLYLLTRRVDLTSASKKRDWSQASSGFLDSRPNLVAITDDDLRVSSRHMNPLSLQLTEAKKNPVAISCGVMT